MNHRVYSANGAQTNDIGIVRHEWFDAARNRKVPAKIYFPKAGGGPFPIVLFSHGLGGSREGYEYLGHYWAAHGYVCVHVQHLGSDDAVWRDAPPGGGVAALRRALADPRNSLARPPDASFAIDKLLALNGDLTSPLQGRLDGQRIGAAGHSFGAFTTLALAGETFPALAGSQSWLDRRVKAAIPMSPTLLPDKSYRDAVYDAVLVPCLHVTGTKDDSPVGDTMAADRRVPFDHIDGADQFLLTFKDGDHMVFVGIKNRIFGDQKNDALFHRLTCVATTAFWDAYLREDAAAKEWFLKELPGVLGEHGVLEVKLRQG